MVKILKVVDRINEVTARVIQWLLLAMVLIILLQVFLRYVLDYPTMWGYEIPIMMGAILYPLSWGYVHLHHGHVRVDVIYSRLSVRGRLIIDVVCALLLFLPLIVYLMSVSGSWMWHAWAVSERSNLTYWHPPIAPLRTALFIGMLLFALQGMAQLVRDSCSLLGRKLHD